MHTNLTKFKTLHKAMERSEAKRATIDMINRTHLSKEIKELAKGCCLGSKYKEGIFRGFKMPSELSKKIRDKNLPDGFSMGLDKNGFFIYTHRGRSKSKMKPGSITVKDIKWVDSTG